MNASQIRQVRKLNRLANTGRLIAARLYTPTPWKPGWLYEQKPRAVLDVLPRANAGRPPRRGVYLQPLPIMGMRQERVSKHAKQTHRYGRFCKKGQDTIERKKAFLQETSQAALVNGLKRTIRGLHACGYAATDRVRRLKNRFTEAFSRARVVMSAETIEREVRS